MQRPFFKAIGVLGVLLLIALGAAWFSRRSGPSERVSEALPASPAPPALGAPSAFPSAAAGAPTVPGERKPKEDILPMPGCWEGVAEFDKNGSLETFRQALSAAAGAGDSELLLYLQERLTELIAEDTGKALQVLAWAEKSAPPELGVYMEALKRAPAVHQPQVVERLLKMGEDSGAQPSNRAAAMDALESQKRLSASSIQRLKALAMDPATDAAGWMATRTLGRVMKEDYERTGTFAPYWNELLDVGEKSEDLAVRLLALEMPSYSDPLIGGESMDRLAGIMRKDPERDVREMAAFRLAVTEDPQKALEAYRTAFPLEKDECVRWALFRFAARAAGPGALPLLQQMAAQDPRFAQDYQDFQRLYAEGTVDFARIWLGVQERHRCTVEEGAPHQ
ncbi:HEAT repeat domain-containing protein [Stigmatella sp. ncwal1]|uniref:HEAT repeat domain-containing protein n=1 Tax=Stigmatella ashevillensis TaxID=2995309 RepID=A0ABT5D1L3_9BACT|nr:HEAT repeat domain-containing protein [Stigmatella ashevillena]MDC0707562.1 HEAT repeat domain-containing protein [Stigmatella ashevillena]